jgi:hypothetical protein
VKQALQTLGFADVVDIDEERDSTGQLRREDLQVRDRSPVLTVDVKGVGGLPSDAEALQADKHASIRMRETGRPEFLGLAIINHQRHLPPLERENKMPFRQEIIDAAGSGSGLMTAWDLYRLVRSFLRNGWKPEDVQDLFYRPGRISAVPCHYVYLGRVSHVFKPAFAVSIQEGELSVGDRLALDLNNEYAERNVASLEINHQAIRRVEAGQEVAVATTPPHPPLKEGVSVFRVLREPEGSAQEAGS